MFYAKITAPNAQPLEMLIDTAADFDIYYSASFNPDCTVTRFNFDLPSGGSYAERKAKAEQIAIDWSYAVGDTALSYGEHAAIDEFFERIGRKYGLLREFRENGII